MEVAEASFWRSATPAALRVWQWKHFVLLPAAALELSSPGRVVLRVAGGCVIAALALAYAYGLNAITDRIDDDEGEKNPLAGLAVLPRATLPLVAFTGAAALALSILLGPLALIATAVSLVASTVYSAGPRWKALPFFGTILNVFIFAPLTVFGGQYPPSFAVRLGAFVAFLLQNQLLHELADAREDARAQVLTTGRLLGEGGVAVCILLLGGCGVIAAVVLAPSPAIAVVTAAAITAVTFTIHFRRAPAARRRTVHRLLAVAAGAVIFAVSLR